MQFERALQALCDSHVQFVVIGGLSATFHGSARVTYDLNICYSRTPGNLRRLAQALAPFHPKPRGFPAGIPFLWDKTTLRNGSIFTLQTDIGEIDPLAEVAGLSAFDDVRTHAMTVEAFGRELLTLDLPGTCPHCPNSKASSNPASHSFTRSSHFDREDPVHPFTKHR